MKMTSREIYQIASETTEKQFNNLLNRLSDAEQKEFESLVRLGDSKEVAIWTVVSTNYSICENTGIYRLAYES